MRKIDSNDYEIHSIDQLRGQDYWNTLEAATELSMGGLTIIEIAEELFVSHTVIKQLLREDS